MLSPYRQQLKEQEKRSDVKKAIALRKIGMSLRDIGNSIGKSYEWVRIELKKHQEKGGEKK